jgi:hypothetical protein
MGKAKKLDRPSEEQLREAADVDVAAGRKVARTRGGVKKPSIGPSPRTARTARRVPQPKKSGRNVKARTTARKSGYNAARKPRARRGGALEI